MGFPIEYNYWSRGNETWVTAECVGIDHKGHFVIKHRPYDGYDVVETKYIDPNKDRREIRFPEGIPHAIEQTLEHHSDEVRSASFNASEIVDEVRDMNLSEMKDLVDRFNLDVKKSQNKDPLKEDIIEALESDGAQNWATKDEQEYTHQFDNVIAEHMYHKALHEMADDIGRYKHVVEDFLRVRRENPENYPEVFDDDGNICWESGDVELPDHVESKDESEESDESESTRTTPEEAEEDVQEKLEEEDIDVNPLLDVQFIVKLGEGNNTTWVGLDAEGIVATEEQERKSDFLDDDELDEDLNIETTTSIGDGIYYCIPTSADDIDLSIDDVKEQLE